MNRDERLASLDPFAFPQETLGRYRMFIATAIIFAWSLGSWVIAVPSLLSFDWRLSPERDRESAELTRGLLRDDGTYGSGMMERFSALVQQTWKAPDSEEGPSRFEEYSQQVVTLLLSQLMRILISLALVTILAVLAWMAYRRHAVSARLRFRTQPLTSTAVQREMAALSELAGIKPPIEVMVKPGFLDGVAFGASGSEVLVLGGEARWLERPWNDVTRAVALHELAHIANGDIRTREVSRYLWRFLCSLIVVLLMIIAIASLFTGELRYPLVQPPDLAAHLSLWQEPPVWTLPIKVGAILFVVWWLWSGLIRAREFYADARVAQWGFRQPLLDRLRLPETARSGWQILRRHPTQQERRQVLEEPQRLFRAAPELAALTGLTFALLIAQLSVTLADAHLLLLLPVGILALASGSLVMLAVGSLLVLVSSVLIHPVVGALGVQVQRESIAELVEGQSRCGYSRLGKTALFFVLGLELGFLISPFSPFHAFRSPVWTAGWIVPFAFLVWLWLLFVKAGARQLLASETGRKVFLWRRLLMLTSSFLLAVLMWPVLMSRLALEVVHQDAWLTATTMFPLTPIQFFMGAFVGGSAQLLMFSAVIYIAMLFGLLVLAELRSWWRRPTCLHCDEDVSVLPLVGEGCHRCREPLAPWAYREVNS